MNNINDVETYFDEIESFENMKSLKLKNINFIRNSNEFLKKFNNRKELTRNQKRLLSKVKEFETWLVSRQGWNVKIIKIDDGVAICKKK